MKTYTGGIFSRVSLATGRPGADVGGEEIGGRGVGEREWWGCRGNTCQRAHPLPTVPQAPCHKHSHSPFYSHVSATGTIFVGVSVYLIMCVCRCLCVCVSGS